MDDELTEKEKAELAEKLGLNSKTESMKSTLFQGDFGFSIDFSTHVPILILAAFLFIHHRRKSRLKKR
ncbi:hypothetical protein M3193_09440 [Sporosarcina luteola]|uniref:hypothetical protein n=1 Tax=Sporosarcina luteola TaxID=582850 RepID=UPI0020411BCE|nr:hypothetical protein [Sporosarcina luteola]MCM3744365.1 hypothetical protein [Sporosarcina luteola]